MSEKNVSQAVNNRKAPAEARMVVGAGLGFIGTVAIVTVGPYLEKAESPLVLIAGLVVYLGAMAVAARIATSK